MQHTIDMIALLSSLYDQVYITKPNTSRNANSEKYIVCKGFLWNSSYKIYPFLYKAMRRILEIPDNRYIDRIFSNRRQDIANIRRDDVSSFARGVIRRNTGSSFQSEIEDVIPIHSIFLNRIEESNIIIGQVQIENIYLT